MSSSFLHSYLKQKTQTHTNTHTQTNQATKELWLKREDEGEIVKTVGGNITKLILPYNMLFNITMNLLFYKDMWFLTTYNNLYRISF